MIGKSSDFCSVIQVWEQGLRNFPRSHIKKCQIRHWIQSPNLMSICFFVVALVVFINPYPSIVFPLIFLQSAGRGKGRGGREKEKYPRERDTSICCLIAQTLTGPWIEPATRYMLLTGNQT